MINKVKDERDEKGEVQDADLLVIAEKTIKESPELSQ